MLPIISLSESCSQARAIPVDVQQHGLDGSCLGSVVVLRGDLQIDRSDMTYIKALPTNRQMA